MISSATFHVITTELVVGSFAMAGVCFLLKAIQSFNALTSEKVSQVCDIVGHFAIGFGLLATPFAILSGISSSPGSDVSSPLLVNKIFLSMIATVIALWFSRRREFRADEGGAQLAGKSKMIRALKKLQQVNEPEDLPGEFAAFGISGRGKGLSQLFLSHPPLDERIAHLNQAKIL